MKPTQEQIADEIAKLKECLDYIPRRTMFGDDNHANVKLQIQCLNGEIDLTADEFNEFNEREQDSIIEADNWRNGDSKESPSSGWDSFKPKTK